MRRHSPSEMSLCAAVSCGTCIGSDIEDMPIKGLAEATRGVPAILPRFILKGGRGREGSARFTALATTSPPSAWAAWN